jgi:hypothetical protein
VEEVMSSNSSSKDNGLFSLNNILLMFGAFIVGFVVMALVFKNK